MKPQMGGYLGWGARPYIRVCHIARHVSVLVDDAKGIGSRIRLEDDRGAGVFPVQKRGAENMPPGTTTL